MIVTILSLVLVVLLIASFRLNRRIAREREADELRRAAAERARIRHLRSQAALADEAEWTSPKRGRRL